MGFPHPEHQIHGVLLALLRERQPRLYHHLRQVGRLSVAVGRRLGMDADQLDLVRQAGELHDVGKAGIPDAILNKPGLLSEDEWDMMRRHTVIGERILLAAPCMAPVAALVRSSNERWDGGGYPDGLEGEDIPLGSRVIFVCDAFDAMISDRPHAEAMSLDEAVGELHDGAGCQFDPLIVRLFETVWRELAAPALANGVERRAEPALAD